MTDALSPLPFGTGAISARVVRGLSGASSPQLGRWHRSGVLEATVLSGGRGRTRMYSWIEYCKARAAVKLLADGLPARRLRPSLERLDEEVTGWWELPLVAFQSHVIVPTENGRGYTILDGKQGAHFSLIEAAPRRGEPDAPAEVVQAIAVVNEMRDEGPLGVLHSFGEVIAMNPEVCAGNPVLIGTRLETAMIAAIHAKSFQKVHEIAERFGLSEPQVEGAVAFERALRSPEPTRALFD